MRALLLAAGFGTRLRPYTNLVPKCLMKINGRPLLGIWLEQLTNVGINKFLINTHYLADQVEEFIESSPFRKNVTLIHEDKLIGTAGTLIKNLEFFNKEDGLLIHADNYCLSDLNHFIQAHFNRPKECILTMMAFRTNDPKSCGIVKLNKKGVMIGFYEKVSNPPGNLANGAVYALSVDLLERLETDLKSVKDFSSQVLPSLLHLTYCYETSSIFLDIGTPLNYELANKLAQYN